MTELMSMKMMDRSSMVMIRTMAKLRGMMKTVDLIVSLQLPMTMIENVSSL